MNAWSKLGAMTALAVAAGHACADVTFYEQENFQGKAYIAQGSVPDLARLGFHDRVASVVVSGTPWEVCDDRSFAGQCMILRPGNYPSLRAMSLNDRVVSARQVDGDRAEASRPVPPPVASGQVTFYSRPGFDGRSFASDGDVADLGRFGFNDRASSIIVRGSERWEVCEDANFAGRCAILGPGSYRDLSAMGLNNSVSSMRLAEPGAQTAQAYVPPPPAPRYEAARDQPFYQVDVSMVHAVYATTDQRCWVERDQVVQDGTAAVADGQVVRTPPTIATQDVRHCNRLPRSGQPDYWDVTYYFHGTEHHVQLATPPGPTIMVDGLGDPRM